MKACGGVRRRGCRATCPLASPALPQVIDLQTGAVFSGASPTKPWTEVCLAHRTGQRISGPLFFGFSDPLTQRAIAANLYNERELRAALHVSTAGRGRRPAERGRRLRGVLRRSVARRLAPALAPPACLPACPQGEQLEHAAETPEELAATEFRRVEGVGEATAIVLARTAALGGQRHSGLASLQAWVGAAEEHASALLRYLTDSEEVPEATRRWPAWRQHVAPKVVLAISGRWLGAGPPPDATGAGKAPGKRGGKKAGAGTARPADTAGSREVGIATATPVDGAEAAATIQAAQAPGQQQQRQALRQAPSQPTAKENRQPAPASQPAAAAKAAAHAGPQRSSGRERRANGRWSEYLTGDGC